MISMKYFLNLDFHQIIKLFLICKRNKKSKAPKGSIKLNKSLKRQKTVVDFWTMVYDTDSTVVVVLELLNEVCTDQCWSFKSNPLIVFNKHVMKKNSHK
jgi:hypothetical protein